MRIVLVVLLNTLLILSIPERLLPKEKTVKITIQGSDQKRPIEVSDPKILANFQVWMGPGTSSAERQGLIVDWSQGPVGEPPQAFRRYQVSFHIDPNEQIVYVVYYAFSPGAGPGYAYVPGESDEWYTLNVHSIFRGVEGKWFRAWSTWERVARPLIKHRERTDSLNKRKPDTLVELAPLPESLSSVLKSRRGPLCQTYWLSLGGRFNRGLL
jgi:hypothetical protein